MDCYSPIPLETTKSIKVDKTNTLHQFDTETIVGLQSPVGKVPIVFYVKDTCTSAHKGILYYGNRDSVCYMFPEDKNAEWMKQPYALKYDALEKWGDEKEWGYERHHGIFELWVNVFREWYNGRVFFRPRLRVQGCGRHQGGYYTQPSTAAPTPTKTHLTTVTPKKTNISRSCGCKKGA